MRQPGPPADHATVRAAGGVIWRTPASTAGGQDKDKDKDTGQDKVKGRGKDAGKAKDGRGGRTEVVLVHRPRYDDWSLPKGKLEPGESFDDAAVREVEEETGLVVELGTELPPVTYLDRHGRPKVVRYWTMTVVAAVPFEPNDEVDEVRWVPVTEAPDLVSYDTDRATLAAYLAVGPA